MAFSHKNKNQCANPTRCESNTNNTISTSPILWVIEHKTTKYNISQIGIPHTQSCQTARTTLADSAPQENLTYNCSSKQINWLCPPAQSFDV
jgi:hypothetical protein